MSAEQPEKSVVFAPCKRGSDPATVGQKCKGREAFKLSATGDRNVRFQCTTCNYEWMVDQGGFINI